MAQVRSARETWKKSPTSRSTPTRVFIKMFAATFRSRRHGKVRTSIHSWEATSSSIRSTADQVPASTGWLSRKTSLGGSVLSQPASRQAPGSRHLASAAAAAMSLPPSGAASIASARRTSSEASRSTEGSQARRSSNSATTSSRGSEATHSGHLRRAWSSSSLFSSMPSWSPTLIAIAPFVRG